MNAKSNYSLKQNDLKREHLLGEVKTYKEEHYYVEDSSNTIIMKKRMRLPLASSFFFNDHGNLTQSNFFNENDEIGEQIFYREDSLKNALYLISIGIDGDSSLSQIIQYNSDHSVRKSEFINKKGETMWFSIFRYSKNGVSEYRYDAHEELLDQMDSELNTNGNIIKSELFKDGKTLKLFRYDFDQRNLLIRTVITINDENLIRTYTYDLDDSGNWIKRIEFAGNKPIKAVIRSFEYYN